MRWKHSPTALRAELWPFDIRVVLIKAGPIRTDFVGSAVRRSAALLEQTESPYAPLYARFTRIMASGGRYERTPDVVAPHCAAGAARGAPAWALLDCGPCADADRSVLPGGLRDAAIRRFYGAGVDPRGR
jgi:NAD(P)-dependent dehydrogenase (short-subunit alcohol dehydrogenase family)